MKRNVDKNLQRVVVQADRQAVEAGSNLIYSGVGPAGWGQEGGVRDGPARPVDPLARHPRAGVSGAFRRRSQGDLGDHRRLDRRGARRRLTLASRV